ncbi:hypothetical protein D1J51_15210 [Leucobacter sp. wl10]|nr:hypothetical protein D1J51_15210 [Leucobacter sp. wl10]
MNIAHEARRPQDLLLFAGESVPPAAHRVSGEKTQAHDHYLKGSVFCGTCGSRLILSNAKSGTGVIYPYFICSGRHKKRTSCDRKAMYVPDVEAAVEDHYRLMEIPEHIVGALRELIHSEFDRLYATAKTERKAQLAERDRLHDERSKLLQAPYAGAMPLDLLKTEQDRIARQVAFLDARIEASSIEYEQARAHLDDCLALAGDAHAIYTSLDDSLRRIANQASFERLTITDVGGIDAEPGEPFDFLFNPAVHATALAMQGAGGIQAGQTGNVASLNNELLVEAMERCGNSRPRVERLVSAWNQGIRGHADPEGEDDDPLIGASAEPKQRPRTRLTDEEVDAMRTVRERGIGVNAVARQFGVHRGTVWAKTR